MSATHLIWIDLEMTGLNVESNRIIEIATAITDAQLQIIAEGPVLVIQQTAAHLATMDAWNTKQHTQSGLLARVQQSTLTEDDAQTLTLAFLQQHVPAGKLPMCGNSICQDRRFLYRYMPRLEAFFHYRNLDVSSIKELATRWAPDILKGFTKQSQHLAMSDIKDSIAELRHYQQHFFRLPETQTTDTPPAE